MSRLIILILSVIFSLVVFVFLVLYYQSSKIVAYIKPEIEKTLSSAVGGKVLISELQAHVFPTPYFQAIGVSFDLPQASGVLQNLSLEAAIWPLFSGNLEIQSLDLKNLAVQLKVANAKEQVGAKAVAAAAGENRDRTLPAASQPPAAPGEKLAPTAVPAWLKGSLRKISLSDAMVSLPLAKNEGINIKTLEANALFNNNEFVVSNLQTAGDLSFAGAAMPFEVALFEIKVFVAPLRVVLNKGGLQIFKSKITFSGHYLATTGFGEIGFDAPAIALANLEKLNPAITALGLSGEFGIAANLKVPPGAVQGIADLRNINGKVGNFQLQEISGKTNFSLAPVSQQLNSPKIKMNVNGESAEFAFQLLRKNTGSLELSSSGEIAGGKFSFESSGNPEAVLNNKLKANDLQLRKILEILGKQNLPLAGKLTRFEATPRLEKRPGGVFDVSSPFSGELKNGRFKGTNVVKEVLSKIKNLPFFSGDLSAAIPAELISGEDTTFENSKAVGNFVNGNLDLRSFDLNSAAFSMSGSGAMQQSGELNLKATILLSAQISEHLVKKVKELRSALDPQGRLRIPLMVNGVAPKVIVLPDMEALLKTVGRQKLEEKANKLLDKAFKGKKGGKKIRDALGGILGF